MDKIPRSLLIPILLLLVLFGSLFGLAQKNYLLFHVLVELSTVVVAASGFLVVWVARGKVENGFFLILGTSLLPVASLSLLHALAYKGMGVFPGLNADPATQLWVASRFLLAGSMALGALCVTRKLRPGFLLVGTMLLGMLLAASILELRVFPSCFLEGEGLTRFKVWAEYVICGLFGLSALFLWKERLRFDPKILLILMAAAIFGVGSELSFTLYTDVYGLMNLVGHLFALGLFGLLFHALVRVGIQRPQDLLLRELALREEALKASEALFSTVFRANPEAMVIFGLQDGRIEEVNEGFLQLTGYRREEVLGRTGQELGLWAEARERMAFMGAIARNGMVRERVCRFRLRTGEIRIAQLSAEAVELRGKPCAVAVARDITEQKRAEEALWKSLQERKEAELRLEQALSKARQREAEVRALLDGARAVLETRDLTTTMRTLYDSCKALVGARAGYVSLLSREGDTMEALFLDSGTEQCQVDSTTPMPIRGLRAQAVASMAPLVENDFAKTGFVELLPRGHQRLESVLFAPLVMEGRAMGLLGLANKPGGFTEEDARLAMAFGEMAAVALQNSRHLDALKESEERLRAVVESAKDAIISVDSQGCIVFWNSAAESVFGYPPGEILGRPLETIMPERFRVQHRHGMLRALSQEGTLHGGRTVELFALRKDGSEFPIELSLARWKSRGETFFTGIIRDVTDRKRAERELRQAHEELEQRVAQRTQQLAESNEALRAEIQWRTQIEEKLQRSQEELRKLSAALLSAQESERKHLAQEIHDSVGQILAAAKFATERALLDLPGEVPVETRGSLEDVVAMVQGAIEEVRRIQMDLRPAVLDDLGILATIGWFCREFQRVYDSIRVERQLEVEEEEVPAQLKIVIFRIMQEAMNNAARHGGGDRIIVSLSKMGSALLFSVEDNGRGMELTHKRSWVSSHQGGMGILGMRERVEFSGGTFAIESEPGKGTRVVARWPVD